MARNNWRASKKNPFRSLRDQIEENDSREEINDYLSHQDLDTISSNSLQNIPIDRNKTQRFNPIHH
jgi:hypothetical protein